MYKKTFLGILVIVLFSFSLSLGEEFYISEKAPDYTDVFCRTYGWTGADGTYSVPLDSGKTVWLFSDTLIGTVNEDQVRSEDTVMINNSIGVQEGNDPSTVKFFFGGTEEARESIFTPPDGIGWYWLSDGISCVGEDRVTLLLGQFDLMEEDGTFGFNFKQIGCWAADFYFANGKVVVENYKKLPYFKIKDDSTVTFGAGILEEEDWIYIYGTEDFASTKKLLVARVPSNGSLRDTPWEFYTGDGWSENMDDAGYIMDSVSNEMSVHKGFDGSYITITQKDGFGAELLLWKSQNPFGPWEDPRTIWVSSEVSDTVLIYNTKAHPELSDEEKGLLISYNVNTCSMDELMEDASVYRPRFIRVRFEKE